MKIKTTSLLAILLFCACTKETDTNVVTSDEQTDARSYTYPTNTPLNDLGNSLFEGYMGGLYPNGSNVPTGTYASDLRTVSNSIVPIDTDGIPNSSKGYIVFLSMGGSTGGKNMKALLDKTRGNPNTNPRLKLMNGNQPAQRAPLSAIMNPNNIYWVHITQTLNGHKSSYKQVQIVYLETDDGIRTVKFPDRPDTIRDEIEACLRTMMKKFPNLKVVYLLGRTRTFANTTTFWNSEPSPYYFGWACKWTIEDQINGVHGTEYKGPNKVAPMATWGFYQWADSLPRKTDNFYWRYSETKDGLHANAAGQDTLATRFQKFLLKDPYASVWYAKH